MSGTCRWGIMATGLIADLFVKDLNLVGLPVSAVGSRSAESARRFAETHNIPTAHDSYAALAEDPDVDAVYVATPHPFHLDCARLALNAGKHVLIEKPLTMNAREAREIADLAASRNLVVLEAMWTRFLPHMVRLREIIAAGTLGDIRSLSADHSQALPEDPTHRLNAMELGGGALLDLGIYPISFAWNILGKPEAVHAVGRFKATGADAEVAMIMKYASGALAQLVCTSDFKGPNTARIIGTKAIVELDSVWYTPTTFRVLSHSGEVLETYDTPVDGRGMQFQAFAMQDAVREGRTLIDEISTAESVEIMELMDEIRSQIGLRYAADA